MPAAERIVVLVTEDEHTRFKVACARVKPKTSMSEQARDLLLRWLRKQEEGHDAASR